MDAARAAPASSTFSVASVWCSRCPCSGLSSASSRSSAWWGRSLRLRVTLSSRTGAVVSSRCVRVKKRAAPRAVLDVDTSLADLEEPETWSYNRWERAEGRPYNPREERLGEKGSGRRSERSGERDSGRRSDSLGERDSSRRSQRGTGSLDPQGYWGGTSSSATGRAGGRGGDGSSSRAAGGKPGRPTPKAGPKVPPGAKAPKHLILKPPMEDRKLTERLLSSPQLTLKAFPVLSACLPSAPLRKADLQWIDENMLEVKDALGFSLDEEQAAAAADEGEAEAEEEGEGEAAAAQRPEAHLDTLLYVAFQHEETSRHKKAYYVRNGHTRLAFLGQYVLELALVEVLLLMYPRETTGCTRERMYLLAGKKYLPGWIKAASMERLLFPDDDIDRLKAKVREPAVKSVFNALIAAIYLTLGMREVYRLLFEVFGINPRAKEFQPKPRSQLEDVDFLSPELEKELSWEDIASYQPPADSLFSEPLLFRACVPPGMHRFRGNLWEEQSLPSVKRVLGYPRPPSPGDSREAAAARNLELELGLQLCFLHPSKYKFDHPRFCNERLELLGSRVMDVILAERLLMKHLEGPGEWLGHKHRKLLMNRICGRLLRDKRLARHMVYSEQRELAFERTRKLRNLTNSGAQQALHGLGYVIYGRPEVRRLMFDVFDTEAGPADPVMLRMPQRPGAWTNPDLLAKAAPAGQGAAQGGPPAPPSQRPPQRAPQFRVPSNYRTQVTSTLPSTVPGGGAVRTPAPFRSRAAEPSAGAAAAPAAAPAAAESAGASV